MTPTSSPPPPLAGARLVPIVRDIALVWILTAIGGFVAGVATGGPQAHPGRFMLAVMVSNLLLGTVAFTISGCLTPRRRWRHLGWVALGSWLTSLVNLAFGVTVAQWLAGAIFMALIMAAGGALSLVFRRPPPPEA